MADHDASPSSSSTIDIDQQESLNHYTAELKLKLISPRDWLRRRPQLAISAAFREHLWRHYTVAYPPPTIPGFTLIDVLGEGGMGRVYLATDNSLKRDVAIKELTSELKRDGVFRERFRNEAQFLAKLKHPHIVEVHQFLTHDGREFMVMEYVERGSLADRLMRGRPESPDASAGWLSKIARAIGHAHAEGIIHRDLKPGNILFDKHGEPKVGDFGLAKNVFDPTDLTHGRAVGTPRYMAPEQLGGKPPVPGTDIWALGVILYQLLTGRSPFENASEICSDEPAPISAAVPADLVAICRKCLRKDPDDRYRRAEELANALERQFPDDPTPPYVSESTSKPRRRTALWLGGAAGLLLLVVATAFVAWIGLSGPRPQRMDSVHSGLCSSIVFAPDGRRAYSESGGAEIFVWDVQRGIKEASKLHGLEQPLADGSGTLAVSSDGKWLAASFVNTKIGNRQGVLFYDRVSLTPAPRIVKGNRIGPSFVFAPDNSQLACVDLGIAIGVQLTAAQLVMYDLKTAKPWSSPLDSLVYSLAYAADGKTLAMGCADGKIRLWDVDARRVGRELAGHTAAVEQLQFADKKRLFSASHGDASLRIWNLETGKEDKRTNLADVASKMTAAAFCSSGRAFTGHVDGTVFLWNMETGKQLYRYRHPGVRVTAVAIAPDGQHGLCALSDRSMYLHRLPIVGN